MRDEQILIGNGISHEIGPHVIVTEPHALPEPVEPPPSRKRFDGRTVAILLVFIALEALVFWVAARL